MTPTYIDPTPIAVDRNLATTVELLIEHSTLQDKITQKRRPGIVGAAAGELGILELHPSTDLPPAAWSTGEQVLWQFIVSVAGKGEVNLWTLASYHRGTPQEPWLLAVLASLLATAD